LQIFAKNFILPVYTHDIKGIEKRRFANRTHAIEFALQQLIEDEKPLARTVYVKPSQDSSLAVAESPGKAYQRKNE